jgi:HD-GYP domain-containing protein (c-di-GMP phosphodiesterase class II)
LRGSEIPLTAQIVGIVDAYDAMTTTRPYRAALSDTHACDELLRDVAKGLADRAIVQKFIELDRAAVLAGM